MRRLIAVHRLVNRSAGSQQSWHRANSALSKLPGTSVGLGHSLQHPSAFTMIDGRNDVLHRVREVLSLYRLHDSAMQDSKELLEKSLRAAHMASRSGACNGLVLAALLHGCGQLLIPSAKFGSMPEEALMQETCSHRIGSTWLGQQGFSSLVTETVARQPCAGRYLNLDDGAAMTPDEANEFEEDDAFEAAVSVRIFCYEATLDSDLADWRRVWCQYEATAGEPWRSKASEVHAELALVPKLDAYQDLMEEHLGVQVAEQHW